MLEQIFSRLDDATFAGNALWRWFAVVLLAYALHGVFRFLARRFSRCAPDQAQSLIGIFRCVLGRTQELLLLIVALWFSSKLILKIDPDISPFLRGAAVLALFVQLGLWAEEAIREYLRLRLSRSEGGNLALRTAFGFIFIGARVVVWAVVLLLVLDNFGVNVTALVAGLGIGGIAIALAVQSTLGDLLCSLSIILDKPFEVGDFIVTGDVLGTVEKIGIKSTRIRSLTGEQIVVSNSDLISSRIRNFKRMQERRIVFSFGVIYQTPPDKLRAIPAMVREIIESNEMCRYDRCHFKAFGSSSLDFETVYYVLSSDFNIYMDTQQYINVNIFERFAKEGIEFAYPTQTLFIESVPGDSDSEQTTGAAA